MKNSKLARAQRDLKVATAQDRLDKVRAAQASAKTAVDKARLRVEEIKAEAAVKSARRRRKRTKSIMDDIFG